MIHVVLVEPEIPPNTGNVIRLCANTGVQLHLVEPLGFPLEDARMRRAGLDYHEYANMLVHPSWQAFLDRCLPDPQRCFAMTTKGKHSPFDVKFQAGDYLMFGSETRGLSEDVRNLFARENWLRLPMRPESRSLNLSNSVAVMVYEAWRQLGFEGGS
ncbi:MAG: tRNA (uridine(34)/cytosine(34)/5-carboxymethylaminomethyluridine(34)-2'-O)-methyltransferase TrmL [Limnobacter sp.]|jgi:tRNA (cytidine/uridine-2'-O-)-methyltransferase|uniref:tRNA (uridine(34)/cytosine(34)/5- carboxymethylaminomethyluridine(34)-2'-O)- methyltransferase TrmL n=1 Tax=unclassified Limnobacter TaxID=2630203 RepID=UPI000C449DBD|nr:MULTISPECIES: tRNA (uridine(34)/cytosine(34)/5-carboxymethylaminomethyluridine(34)-2'-O)-methyltransferase TrmL [unclassified Limnobacter]MAG79827.1 tRNA (uridine(34)/cytosine(34)/5-carboxymethylaminomethyluridine(34)-2'-O)-methyltransferase TrmL [Sutterellaceae bacterium]MDZ4051370.1 tRNA (uridine(34)/cytosine(34)/5-carboxymethylaminomethyluridine(34)-2'-O)-methyltransferase TrmL [Limnobacter sp.]RZO93429.1 MAG: tRNA (uridine(34)/cytosine(34)/5-carboxymethylaminomethyluridine(34)-2'-O)-methy|tara:strand:- start:98 stop:568 length:471 start_codon:yes stop_codon:yes gene_type:complete